jgi:methyl-accepting chemotaxis protein
MAVAVRVKSGASESAAPAKARSSRTAAREEQADVTEGELRALLDAMRAGRNGSAGVRLKTRKRGLFAELCEAFNDLTEVRENATKELVRVSNAIGRDGRLDERARPEGFAGTWVQSIDAVNTMISDLARPTVEVARVLDAVARGDLSQKIELTIEGRPIKGEFRRMGTTVNTMVDQLSSFAAEVTRVAREVGTEGKLGGQAQVKGVSGVWKDLTDSVNSMAENLTGQVRNVAEVTTAVASGVLS